MALSPGGSDAIVRREFDLVAKKFVADKPFRLDEPSKSRCSWLDKDTLFLGVDLKDGDLTTSGYPRTLREWTRGTDPRDAPVVFEGEASDVSCGGYVSRSRGSAFESRPGRVYDGGPWTPLQRLRLLPFDGAPRGRRSSALGPTVARALGGATA